MQVLAHQNVQFLVLLNPLGDNGLKDMCDELYEFGDSPEFWGLGSAVDVPGGAPFQVFDLNGPAYAGQNLTARKISQTFPEFYKPCEGHQPPWKMFHKSKKVGSVEECQKNQDWAGLARSYYQSGVDAMEAGDLNHAQLWLNQ